MASDSPHPDEPALKGDVVLDSVKRINGRIGKFKGIIEMRLVGHPYVFQVRIDHLHGAPRLVELHILPLPGSPAEIDSDTIRAVPTQRLANAAAQFIGLTENRIALAGQYDDPTRLLRPDHVPGRTLDDAHYRQVRNLLIAAREMGLAPREYVKKQLHASIPSVDRWIAEAKRRGFLDPDWSNNNGTTIE